jgi:hypothetical protein
MGENFFLDKLGFGRGKEYSDMTASELKAALAEATEQLKAVNLAKNNTPTNVHGRPMPSKPGQPSYFDYTKQQAELQHQIAQINAELKHLDNNNVTTQVKNTGVSDDKRIKSDSDQREDKAADKRISAGEAQSADIIRQVPRLVEQAKAIPTKEAGAAVAAYNGFLNQFSTMADAYEKALNKETGKEADDSAMSHFEPVIAVLEQKRDVIVKLMEG